MDLPWYNNIDLSTRLSNAHTKLVDQTSKIWTLINPKLKNSWSWIQHIWTRILMYMQSLYKTNPYAVIGVGSCAVMIVTYRILTRIKTNQNEKTNENNSKENPTDE